LPAKASTKGMKAKASYEVKKWKEETYQQISSSMKMTRASVEFALHGDPAGIAAVEYVMFYKSFDPNDQHKSSASYVSLMRFDGKVSGKSGSFAMQDQGSYEAGAAKSTLKVIEGSGTGELKAIRGNATYLADQKGATFELDYWLG